MSAAVRFQSSEESTGQSLPGVTDVEADATGNAVVTASSDGALMTFAALLPSARKATSATGSGCEIAAERRPSVATGVVMGSRSPPVVSSAVTAVVETARAETGGATKATPGKVHVGVNAASRGRAIVALTAAVQTTCRADADDFRQRVTIRAAIPSITKLLSEALARRLAARSMKMALTWCFPPRLPRP